MNKSGASSGSSAIDGAGNTISRSSLKNCNTNNSNLRRCDFTNCVLSNVENASRSSAKDSQLHDVILAERSDIRESAIRSGSSVHRSDLRKSVVQEKTSIERSVLNGAVVSQSQVQRTSLVDCDVTECVISRSSFTGMVLKYGIWKKGVLVGKTGDMEPIQIKRNVGPEEMSNKHMPSLTQELSTPDNVPELDSTPVAPFSNAVELDSKTQPRSFDHLHNRDDDSDVTIDSEDTGDDLPPSYESAIRDEIEEKDAKRPQI